MILFPFVYELNLGEMYKYCIESGVGKKNKERERERVEFETGEVGSTWLEKKDARALKGNDEDSWETDWSVRDWGVWGN